MNTSPWLEILVALALLLFFGGLIWSYIYKKKHHIPTGDCACCKSKKMIKEYHKMYPKEK